MTTTTHYSLTLPNVGGNVNQWGLLTNNNWSSVDAILFDLSNNTVVSTGNITSNSGVVVSNTVASGYRACYARTSGSNRWAWGANFDEETGVNAGSSYFLNAYADDGSYIDSPISISRAANGVMTISRPVSLGAGSTAVTQSSSDSSTKVATTAFVHSVPSILTGSIIMWPKNTPPTGYYECDGSAKNTTTDAALFAIIGYTFGGAGASFNLPDFRGYFPRGWANAGSVDAGRAFGSTQAEAFESHTHTATSIFTGTPHSHSVRGQHNASSGSGDIAYNGGAAPSFNTESTVAGGTVATTNSSTGGAETRPVNLAIMFIIKR